MIITPCCMQLFLGAEQFSVLNKGKCIQIPWYFCLHCLPSTKLFFLMHFHILILLCHIQFWNKGNCKGCAPVGWYYSLQVIQSCDSIFGRNWRSGRPHFWIVTEGVLQDKEIFNLVSSALVSLHFAVWVVQQTRTNLSPGQMLYLTQSWLNPSITKSWPASDFSLHY